MNPNRRPFDLRVLLPGGRVYRTRAAEAVMLSSTPAGDPDRLMVQPPAAGLDPDATQRLIAGYAAEWGFPADAATGWRTGVERRIGSDRNYSTHVFHRRRYRLRPPRVSGLPPRERGYVRRVDPVLLAGHST